MKPISSKSPEFQTMKSRVKSLCFGLYDGLKITPRLRRAEGNLTIIAQRIYPSGGGYRFAWTPYYAGYIDGKKVADSDRKPGDEFVRALVRATMFHG